MSSIAKPFGILLLFLYEIVNNYGLALILFALVIRFILLPFQMKSKRGMMRQARLQPKIAELQKKHGTNKAKINEEMAKLYKEEGVNPASGCLWSFLPLPIMLALFLVIRQPLTMMLGVPPDLLAAEPLGAILAKLQQLGFQSTVQPYYIEVDQAQFISSHFAQFASLSPALRPLDFNFGLLNLGAQPQWNFLWTTDWSDSKIWVQGLVLFIIPLLSTASQFLATLLNKKINPTVTPEGQGGGMQIMMMLMPLMSLYFAFITPAALGFYWTIGTLLQVLQDYLLTKRYSKILDAEDLVKNEERKKKEADIEAKRLETERKKAEGLVERNPNTSKRKKQVSEKQGQLERASEWEKKHAPAEGEGKYEPGREGNRRFARGRAYDPDRFTRPDGYEAGGDLRLDSYDGGEDGNDENDDYGADGEAAPGGEYDDPEIGGEDGEAYDGDDEIYGDEDDEDEADEVDEEAGSEEQDTVEHGDNDEPNSEGSPVVNGESHETPPTVRFDTTRFDGDTGDKK